MFLQLGLLSCHTPIPVVDLLIAADSLTVHLAGAMGVPAWLMLPFVPDWRWLMGRADTPWYPHTRLFAGRSEASGLVS